MYWTTAGRAAMIAGGLQDVATHASLHTGSPISAGGNEATGGSPAYARQALSWAAPASGQGVTSTAETFDVPAGTYTWLGLWTASTSGTFLGAAPLGGKTLKSVSVDANTETFTNVGHGLLTNDIVVMFDVLQTGMPTSFTEGTSYYLVNAAANTFQLSATEGGSVIATTTSTEVVLVQLVPVVLSSQGTITIPSGSLILNANVL